MSEFLFGSGFAVAGGEQWRVRRKAVGPSLHRAYLSTMISRVFGPSAAHLNEKLEVRLVATLPLLARSSTGRCWPSSFLLNASEADGLLLGHHRPLLLQAGERLLVVARLCAPWERRRVARLEAPLCLTQQIVKSRKPKATYIFTSQTRARADWRAHADAHEHICVFRICVSHESLHSRTPAHICIENICVRSNEHSQTHTGTSVCTRYARLNDSLSGTHVPSPLSHSALLFPPKRVSAGSSVSGN